MSKADRSGVERSMERSVICHSDGIVNVMDEGSRRNEGAKIALEVLDLTVVFETDDGPLVAAKDVSFSLERGRTLCIVGESGCGKSATALALLKLLPPYGRIESGRVELEGQGDILGLTERQLQSIRGNEISIVFQEPMTSLNPVHTIGRQVVEVIRAHEHLSRGKARNKAIEVLEMVGFADVVQRFDAYPHELSGGMRQRVMIAMALACRPSVLIADEPTTALDVTIQAQILDLLASLKRDLGMAVVLITHDLGVVAETADDVVVMYAGRVMERATAETLLTQPAHPYTQALLASVPRPDRHRGGRLPVIPGAVPDLLALKEGCTFADRCTHVFEPCRETEPGLRTVSEGHDVRCYLVSS